MTLEFLDLRGERIAYRRSGTGVPVLLAHSLGTNSAIWESTAAMLGERFETIAFDCRGHGASSNHGGISLDTIARDAVSLMAKLGHDRFHYVGVSMGGLFGITAYANEPARLLSLAVIGSHARPAPQAGDRLAATRQLLGTISMRTFAERYVDDTLMPDAATQLREQAVAAIAAVAPHDYLQTLEAILGADVEAILPSIAIPTLVMVGAEDRRAPPEAARAIAAAIPGSRFELIERAGHLPLFDNPTRFQAALFDFLAAKGE